MSEKALKEICEKIFVELFGRNPNMRNADDITLMENMRFDVNYLCDNINAQLERNAERESYNYV